VQLPKRFSDHAHSSEAALVDSALLCTGVVASMDWSVDSEMLAMVVARSTATGSGSPAAANGLPRQHWVQVWRRSNWHWYLKHEARHDAKEVCSVVLSGAGIVYYRLSVRCATPTLV
jgi:IKI3 family